MVMLKTSEPRSAHGLAPFPGHVIAGKGERKRPCSWRTDRSIAVGSDGRRREADEEAVKKLKRTVKGGCVYQRPEQSAALPVWKSGSLGKGGKAMTKVKMSAVLI